MNSEDLYKEYGKLMFQKEVIDTQLHKVKQQILDALKEKSVSENGE